MTEQIYYTLPEVCSLIRLSRSKTYTIIRAGDIRLTKIGGKSLVSKEDLEAFRAKVAKETEAAYAARSGAGNETGKAA